MTDIIYEAYSGPDSFDGVVQARLAVRTLATDIVGGFGFATLPLTADATGTAPSADATVQAQVALHTRGSSVSGGLGMVALDLTVNAAADSLAPPSVAVGAANLPAFAVHGTGFTTQDATVAAALPLNALATNVTAFGRASLTFPVYASDGLAPLLKSGFLLQQPMVAAHAFQGIVGIASSNVRLTDGPLLHQVVWMLHTMVRMSDSAHPYVELLRAIHDAVGFHDFVEAVFKASVHDGVHLTDSASLSQLHLFALIDHVTFLTGASSTQEVTRAVALVLALHDQIATPIIQQLLSGFGLSATLTMQIELYAAALDRIRLTDGLGASLLLQFALADSVVLSDHADLLQELVKALRDALVVTASLTIEGEGYTAWVMGMDTKTVWQYQDYPFNSFATVGNQRFAAGPDGISAIGGADDNGNPIAWSLQTGLSNLGSMLEKRLDCAYLGYTSTGDVGMSVVVRDADGVFAQYNYTLDPIVSDTPVTNRIKLGRGLESVYYAFRFAGTGPFSLDNARVLKLNLRRRV